MNFSAANLIGGIIFGSIGFVAFVYGKKMAYWRSMTIGILLMAYSYAMPDTRSVYIVGVVLTVLLFIFRD